MSVTLQEVKEFEGKDVILHRRQEDGSLAELTAHVKMATEAGIAVKVKGKSALEFIPSIDEIEEIAAAPVKAKSVVQKKLKPIEVGQARQHLLDRHGIDFSWAKDADEQAAFEYHQGLDHSNLGHVHEAPKPDEREKALAES